MSCELTEKVSALLDDELDEQEAESVRQHLSACETCRQAEQEFLLLRRELKSYAGADSQTVAERQQRTLRRIIGYERVPLWRRRIALPAPALALLLLALISLSGWLVTALWQKRFAPEVETAGREKKIVPQPPTAPPAAGDGDVDLARFDRGGRAAIYKVRRENPESTGQ